jgi:hypothetical protein
MKQDDHERIVHTKSAGSGASREDTYHMIPIDRMERNRQELEAAQDKNIDGEPLLKSKTHSDKKDKESDGEKGPSDERLSGDLSSTVNDNSQEASTHSIDDHDV